MSPIIRCQCLHPAGLHVWNGCQVQIEEHSGVRRCACTMTSADILARVLPQLADAHAPALEIAEAREPALSR